MLVVDQNTGVGNQNALKSLIGLMFEDCRDCTFLLGYDFVDVVSLH